ncbi:hypothetical protein DFH09DRAFT_1305294 [Mycena vulgaris]|nr:hypothetical protein DFH09DRAFT_1305294 [Mycena vulgaris]
MEISCLPVRRGPSRDEAPNQLRVLSSSLTTIFSNLRANLLQDLAWQAHRTFAGVLFLGFGCARHTYVKTLIREHSGETGKLSDLCFDLLQEIALNLPASDIQALRAVSRQLQWAIQPLFLASVPIVLNLDEAKDNGVEQLEALAAGGSGFSELSRKLVIRSLNTVGGEAERRNNLLRDGLGSLKSVRSLHWTMSATDPE